MLEPHRNYLWLLIGIGVFLILLVAGRNYVSINSNIKSDYQSALSIIYRLDSISFEETFSSMPGNIKDSIRINPNGMEITAKSLNEAIHSLRQVMYEIESNKKGVLDSNAITFLVSFVFVVLTAIFWGNDKKFTDAIKEIEKHRLQLEEKVKIKIQEMAAHAIQMEQIIAHNEKQWILFQRNDLGKQKFSQFIINIQTIHLIAVQLNIELSRTNMDLKGPVNEYARMIDNEITELIKFLNEGFLYSISEAHKYLILDKLRRIEGYISSENVFNPANPSVISRALISAQQHLQELCEKIAALAVQSKTQTDALDNYP